MSCPDCFSGHVHPGTPAGSETTLHNLPTYVTEPPEGTPVKGLIVVVPDAFGWKMVNTRLLADVYAKRAACRVYVVDFMDGTAAPSWLMPLPPRILNERGLWGWLVKPWLILQAAYGFIPFLYYNMLSTSYTKVKAFMSALRTAEGSTLPIGAVGFCWGGYHVTQLAHGELAPNGKLLVDAVFTGHPSGLVLPGDIEKIKMPYSVSIGDIDFALSIRRVKQMQQILERKKAEVDSEVVVVPGAAHGFAVRGNPENPREKDQADLAEDQCVRWFAKYLV